MQTRGATSHVGLLPEECDLSQLLNGLCLQDTNKTKRNRRPEQAGRALQTNFWYAEHARHPPWHHPHSRSFGASLASTSNVEILSTPRQPLASAPPLPLYAARTAPYIHTNTHYCQEVPVADWLAWDDIRYTSECGFNISIMCRLPFYPPGR